MGQTSFIPQDAPSERTCTRLSRKSTVSRRSVFGGRYPDCLQVLLTTTELTSVKILQRHILDLASNRRTSQYPCTFVVSITLMLFSNFLRLSLTCTRTARGPASYAAGGKSALSIFSSLTQRRSFYGHLPSFITSLQAQSF